MNLRLLRAFACILLFAQCNGWQQNNKTVATHRSEIHPADTPQQAPVQTTDSATRTSIGYRAITSKDSIRHALKYFSAELPVLFALNRVDSAHIVSQDTLIAPQDMSLDILQYSPFPSYVPGLKDVNKILLFSYPAEYFAAYENGRLVRSGPTSMGRKKDTTATGLFYCNWKAEETKSTFNDEWDLKWNFNIQNKEGIGFHQYTLPGYPASHSCLRLLEDDAKYLYDWADQWVIKGTDNIQVHGTPVFVFGAYPFGSRKPWRGLLNDSHALDISADSLANMLTPHLQDIMKDQQKRGGHTLKK
jgi:lipoprotein-anchoring transpeptidase ErfK/SrfK